MLDPTGVVIFGVVVVVANRNYSHENLQRTSRRLPVSATSIPLLISSSDTVVVVVDANTAATAAAVVTAPIAKPGLFHQDEDEEDDAEEEEEEAPTALDPTRRVTNCDENVRTTPPG